jgi:hypothetical protein
MEDLDANRASASGSVTVQDSPRMLEPDGSACAPWYSAPVAATAKHRINTASGSFAPKFPVRGRQACGSQESRPPREPGKRTNTIHHLESGPAPV